MSRTSASAHLDQLAGIFRHDLRNTLTGVSGVADLLREELHGALPDDQQELLDLILSSAHELQDQLDTLAELIRLDAGTLVLQTEDTPLRDLCLRAAAGLGAAAHISPCPAAVTVDPKRFEHGLAALFTHIGAQAAHISITLTGGDVHLTLPAPGLNDDQRALLTHGPWNHADGRPRHSFGTDLHLAWFGALARTQGGTFTFPDASELRLTLPGNRS